MTSLFEPDDFLDDWYGWLTNQVSHIYAFHEVSVGSLEVMGVLTDLIPFFAVATIHLACGVAFRYYRADSNKGKN